IGCEEGYCAVGLARRHSRGKTYAFDIDEGSQRACRKLAEINGVADRMVIGGACDCATLQTVLQEDGFVYCDCEGFEYEVLDPVKVHGLARADILVELHDFVRMDLAITPAVLERFRGTHDISVFAMDERDPAAYPCLECIPA